MVEAVHNPCGNHRVISGLWEAGFFFQRFVDVVAHMPVCVPFEGTRRSAIALLKLSEGVCAPAKLARHTLGDNMSVDGVSKEQISARDA